LIQWTPELAQVGIHDVTVRASDGVLASTQSYTIGVTETPNNPPSITSTPMGPVVVDQLWTYQVTFTDPDSGDTHTFSLPTAPSGMSIDASGLVSWTPTASQEGDHPVSVQVADNRGGTATQSFTLTVQAAVPPQPPQITSTPVTTAVVNEAYVYDVEANDANGDPITYSLEVAPTGMSIDPGTGLINWTPTDLQVGANPVTVRATDGSGYQDQSYTVTVTDVSLPLDVFVSATPSVIDAGGSTTLSVGTSGGVVGSITLNLTVDGVPVVLDGNDQAVITETLIGGHEVTATATDPNETISSTIYFSVRDPADTTPPTVDISSPATDSEISAPVDIIGTADDTNLVNYRLLMAPAGSSDYTELTVSTTPVINGVLGQFDPTSLTNGLYDVVLIAIDANGQQSSRLVSYNVTGDMKVGNFSFTIEDLSIPVSGIPITINRTYDTRRKHENLDFGYGWSVDYQDVKVEENMVLGEAWQQTASGGFFPTYCIEPIGDHIVTVTLPDGTTEDFDMTVSPRCQQLIPIQFTDPIFNPRPGTTSTLVAEDVGQLWYVGGQLLDSGFFEPYDPTRYTLTTKDGYIYSLDQNFGIRNVTDPNGNSLTYSINGVIHSSGKSVSFTRDIQGRITAITDPNGNVISYTYNAVGDLVAVTDRENYSTRHKYNRNHGLTDYIDPRGITPARNIYDSSGKLIAHIDADGNQIDFTHDVEGRQEISQDRLGRTTLSIFDDSGNVLARTDALGNTTSFTYDADGNALTETDALGNTTSRTFDSLGNQLTETDPLGNITTRTYNSRSQELSTTDPNGNTTTKAYDSKGNLTTITDALGNSRQNIYDSAGNQTSVTDEAGVVTNYAYDSSGNRIQEVDASGTTINFTYDANGNRLLMSRTRTTDSGSVNVVTENIYDANSRVIAELDGNGNQISRTYNAIGKISSEIDANGNQTDYEYDARGNQIRIAYADGTEELFSYDAEDNKISETDRGGRTTTVEYDALNRLVRTTYPDLSEKRIVYDDVGHISQTTDENGNSVLNEYDAAGRLIREVRPLGMEMQYSYDANGSPTSITDANGNAVLHTYDALNRRIETSFEDGTVKQFEYDAVGRKISETDQAGITTLYAYDELGRLVQVTDALGGVTGYSYDEFGNKLTQTDANGNTTSWEYDNVGNMVRHTLPGGQSELFTYDPNGNVLSHTDFNGSVTSYLYDTNNQLLEKIYNDGSSVEYVYTPTGQVESISDHRGITNYTYDARDRIVRIDNPDGSFLAYTYDAVGNIISLQTPSGTVTNTYDQLNRLSTVTDADGGVTTYSYDAVGNRESVTYPNGTVTEYTYDSINRLTNLVNRRADNSVISRYDYTLAPAGNRTRVVETTGSGVRTIDYTYDSLYRLVQEVIADIAATTTIDYTYDAVGNRLTKTIDGLVTIDYEYDVNDRLTSEGTTTYLYDDNGNVVSKVDGVNTTDYTYDFENRLIAAVSSTDDIGYIYDAAGNRVGQTVNGLYTGYLVDTNREYAQVLEERDSSNVLIVSYVYGDDLISQNRGGTVSYYHYDGLGTTRALTNSLATITDEYEFDAFGNLLNSAGSTINNYLFTGEQYDPNIGFYYLRARYYDPNTGRFTTIDPFAGLLFEPITLHRYLYAGVDPVNNIDPSGKFFGGFAGFSLNISIGIRLYLSSALTYAAPGLYLLQRIVTRLNVAYLTRLVNLATATFYQRAQYVLGLKRNILRLDAGRIYEQYLRPAMRLIGGQYHQRIAGAIPDWIIRGRHIVDAKLGQAINLSQLRHFAVWASQNGGNVIYITLTRTPPSVKAQAEAVAQQYGVRVIYIALTPF
jgi:RHS repeat-associated protein